MKITIRYNNYKVLVFLTINLKKWVPKAGPGRCREDSSNSLGLKTETKIAYVENPISNYLL